MRSLLSQLSCFSSIQKNGGKNEICVICLFNLLSAEIEKTYFLFSVELGKNVEGFSFTLNEFATSSIKFCLARVFKSIIVCVNYISGLL